jgi:prepilin-type N-terminal cleavage/methylation domain-containing protein
MRRAFTLIEVLMVLAILGVVTAVTIPSMVQSIRGNRLRAASRTVIQMGRYARSMAVLRQQEMTLTFDLVSQQVTARPGGSSTVSRRTGEDAESDAEPELSVSAPEPALTAPGAAAATAARTTGISGAEPVTRRLDRVKIESVAIGEDSKEQDPLREGVGVMIYSSNGRCRPYTVVLRDEMNARTRIKVDALASATTEALEPGTETGGGEP